MKIVPSYFNETEHCNNGDSGNTIIKCNNEMDLTLWTDTLYIMPMWDGWPICWHCPT